MDDAAVHSLPDDPLLLKSLLIQRLAERQERQERLAQLQEQNQQIKLEIQRIESLHQQRVAELELDKLRLQQQLMVAMKKLYGPRGDSFRSGAAEGDVAQLLLEFATDLEGRPVEAADLPADTSERGVLLGAAGISWPAGLGALGREDRPPAGSEDAPCRSIRSIILPD